MNKRHKALVIGAICVTMLAMIILTPFYIALMLWRLWRSKPVPNPYS